MDWLTNHCSCPTAGAEPAFAIRDLNFRATPVEGRMMRCPACAALFPDAFPAPAVVTHAYAGYYTARAARGGWRGWLRGVTDRWRRPYLRRHLPAGARRVLDYGCGSGAYLTAVNKEGPGRETFGTDLGGPPAETGSYRWLESSEVATAAPFDWITLGHVLEHLADPAEVIAGLAGRLAPGGGLWIATPNSESLLFRAAGSWARDVDFPRHREIFSRRGLDRLVGDAGLSARFVSPPRLNAALNAASTIVNMLRDPAAGRWIRLRAAAGVCTALAAHCLSPRKARDQTAPELIAICRAPTKP
ncbi:MAG TPA: class I SAM-dependent methyltransferase [Caulobacteraceae bacterium]|nr:class I SAM-dependent methyltransferase [Caulobacteraceae bacterium]